MKLLLGIYARRKKKSSAPLFVAIFSASDLTMALHNNKNEETCLSYQEKSWKSRDK